MSAEQLPIWTKDCVKGSLPKRGNGSHKGTYGTGLLLAGSDDMPGAALLAGIGAMRSGLGKLVIGTCGSAIPLIVPVLPEATYWRDGLEKAASSEIAESYRAIAIGPGLPLSQMTEQAVRNVLTKDCPVVLDAGALSKRTYQEREAPVILTPHPGEFSKMTGLSIQEIETNRAGYARDYAEEHGVTLVLKGNETIIAFPDGKCWRNVTGNGALAKGGTGDTLTGMLLGMLCCHENPREAVLNAVHLHGACADAWTKTRSAHTLLAHELSDLLPTVWKAYEDGNE
ncbi:NAD(P)H-hydrate dehydratase [Bacillus paralicheniformis]|uniref:NAD(P)H-hydrate dehydratase n=1 Tax=Bacillus TaxID=1386 RepID=UPI000C7609FE|nr:MULTISPECIES: NAD(P)H-hydrate dehydratase [Bacillus]MCD2367258.1 NAD(P)H-hydrate dehydratase [Bacillus sp. BS3(2021)]MCJ8228651.1 NAD(P)H-hydrate dehydratase [Bacillus paralicheniformis]MCY8038790.1 NAD(P)H-hydrate dehydratase [Bacillus paralicheniformis]MCY8178063.1 NAD(P)H-hydrate dehydratase [Bacillus paralicheniformis]MEC4200226.1 NAD(P)H-hydrate dehydratase [Bacillus sp. AAVF1]